MKEEIYQTIIYELNEKNSNKDLNLLLLKMNDSASIFFICKNVYDENNIISKSSLDYTEQINSCGFNYVNTIILPESVTDDNVQYLLWFVKSHEKMLFIKDNIREKHIWKDVEWGKRKKNYNPKGKDPGNVWLPTKDDGKGKITEHIILSDIDIIERCITSTSRESDAIYIHYKSKLPKSKILINRKVDLTKSLISKNKIKQNNSKPNSKPNSKKLIKTKPKVVFDSAEEMTVIKNGTVDLMITSPPYWNLKDYFKDGQIGQESYQQYLDRLKAVWMETYRALNHKGSMWININTRVKNKKPILIPQDIIKQCREIGFKLNEIIVWHKSSGIPTHKNNIVDRFEYFLWFVKSDDFTFNHDYLTNLNDYKNKNLKGGLLWNINRKAGSVGKDFIHPAIYPVKLIERIIELCSCEGQLVLDPFLGSGTSLIAAENTHRSFIGYEYNEEFESLIKHRLENSKINKENVEFINMNKKRKIDRSNIFR